MRNVVAISAIVMVLLFAPAMSNIAGATTAAFSPENLTVELVATRSHPNLAFTQGLIIEQQEFIESSGLYKQSFVQRYPIDEQPGSKPVTKLLAKSDFAEGLAAVGSHLWLITWQQGLARKLSISTFKQDQLVRYKGEGWGLTFDGRQLIMSDGTDTLQLRDADSFQLQGTLQVQFNGQPLTAINELEFAQGYLWANVWFDHRIYAIDPNSGEVRAVVDLSDIIEQERKLHPFGLGHDSVANGIAYDAHRQGLWVTGKRWRKMYLLVPQQWPAQ